MKKIMVMSALVLAATSAIADDKIEKPEKVAVALTQAYIPGGFDSNDRAEMVIEGYFPNTCYRVGPIEKRVNNATKEVTVSQIAYKYKGTCLMMIVPFTQTVQLGILRADTYNVKDAANNKTVGKLPVSETKSSNPDDFVYAHVTDAYMDAESEKNELVVYGSVPGSCWKVKDIRAFQDGKNVIAVLPILEKTEVKNCDEMVVPFVSRVTLPEVESGRYLIHVRSQNGVAVNKLADL